MSVMICLGNPRTMEEIKVNSSINPSMIVIMMMIIIRSSRVLKGHLGPSKAFQGLQWPSRPSRAFNGLPVPSKAFKGLPWPFKSLPRPSNIQMCLKQKNDETLSGDDCGGGPRRRWDCDEGRIHKNVGEEKMTCASLVIFHFQLLCVKYRMNKCLL